MYIDTHAHLNFEAFEDDRKQVIGRSLKESVFMINVGSNYGTSKLAVDIAQEYEKGVYASVALHPIYIAEKLKTQAEGQKLGKEELAEVFDYEEYKKLARNKKVVAIGETGLDAMYPNPDQEKVFLEHLKLAFELDLPVILHCRKAHQKLIEILRDFQFSNGNKKSPSSKNKGVLHCFTGRWSEAKQYLDMGLYLGFNGIIFKYDVEETIRKAPLNRILIETDCPYLTPPLARRNSTESGAAESQRNEPIFVKYVAQKIAEIRGESLEKIAQAAFQNAKNLFNIKD